MIDDYRDQSIDITFSGPPRLVYFGRPLGLSAARAIVLEHGGTLTVRNRSGGGLEAQVVLPVQVG